MWIGNQGFVPSDAGYRLDVNGTARVSGDAIINEQTIGKGLGNQSNNFAAGKGALKANTTGNFNTAIGSGDVLGANQTGNLNVAVGTSALLVSTGSANVAIGGSALINMTSGANNVAVGDNAGRFISGLSNPNTISTDSIYIGRNTQALAISQTNQIVIGTGAVGLGSNTIVLGNASTSLTWLGGSVITGGTSISASAQFQIDSTTKGFLPPRMTTTQKNAISSPAAGLVVYDSTTNKLCCYNGTTWNDLF